MEEKPISGDGKTGFPKATGKGDDNAFRFLFDNTDQGVFYLRTDGRVIDVNPAALRLFGLSRKEFLSHASHDPKWRLIQEDGTPLPADRNPAEVAQKTGKPVLHTTAGIFNPETKAHVWVSINAVPRYRPGENRPRRVMVTLLDITDHKQLQEDFKRRKQALENTLAAATDGIWAWNFNTGALHFSDRYYEMLGYTPKEFAASFENWANLLHPEDREAALETAKAYLETKPDVYVNEFRLRTKAGDYRWIHTKARVVERNQAGEALCIIGNHEDITERKEAETALRESERRYRDLFTNSPLGIFRSTFAGRFLEVNPALARMLGYDSPETVIREIYNIQEQIYINGEKRKEIIAKQHDATGVAQYINRYQRKDGTEFTANLYLKTIRTDDGDPLYLEGIVEDVTDRIRAETALRESEEKFRRCFDTDLVAVAVSRRRDGMYVEANPGFLKLTGYSYDEVVGRRALDLCFYPPSRRQSMLDELEQKGRLHNRELTFPAKDGTWRTILFSLSPLVLNGEDCLLATMVDITDRKRAEDALEKVRKRYELATRKGEVGIWDWDLKTGDLFISKNLREMLGYADREMEKHIEAFARHIHTADLEAVVEAVNACIEGEKPDYNVEHRLVPKDGDVLWVLASGKVERDEVGRPVRFVGTLTNISKRKRLEEQLQHARKMESIGTLIAGIAHEFNNLLFIILGNTELAADETVSSDPKHAYYKTIQSACLRGKNIVTKLLTFSRTPAERKRNLNLSKLVTESRSLIRTALTREITFETALSDDCDGIYADETQLRQILLDLVRNADHAMAERGGTLRIAVENATLDAPEIFVDRTLAPGNYVRLTVSDTGCGIPEINLDRLFDPFFTTKEVGCGTGLGLSAVHGIVSGHDGGIRIRSTEGRETLVECLFPARHAADRAHEPKPPEIAGGSEAILYVDAESFIVNLAKTRLERKGYTVVGTTNPAAALEMITACPDRFDLVVTDLAMPAAGGEELAAVIRKRRPDLPIVICSGYGDTAAEEKARKIGAHAYIMKPIGRDEFAGVVRSTLDAVRGISNHR